MITIKANLDSNQGKTSLDSSQDIDYNQGMIHEYICYKCKCDKCGKDWITKSNDVPKVCPKCHSVKWNEFSEPVTQIDAIRTPQIVQPSQPIQDEPKDALAAFIAKAQAKKGIAPSEIITTEPELVERWIFSSPKVDFADNGNAYREQYLFSNPKKRRTVQVDYDINDRIIEQ